MNSQHTHVMALLTSHTCKAAIVCQEISSWFMIGVLLVLQTVVSSAAPSNLASDTIAPPWNVISLVDERMKPFYAPPVVPVPAASSGPWIPIAIGAVSAGTLVYFATREKDDPTACDFTAEASVAPASCGLSNGSIQVTTSVTDSIAYQWSTGQTTPSLQHVAAGQY